MNIKEENIKIFRDTLKQIANDDQLQEFVKHSKTHQNFYSGRMEFDMKPEDYPSYFGKADIVVTKNGSFNAARRYSQSKVAVLNFASATNPGGGVTKGSNAHEHQSEVLKLYFSNEENRKKLSDKLKGIKLWTNGTEFTYSHECPEGFWKAESFNKGKHWVQKDKIRLVRCIETGEILNVNEVRFKYPKATKHVRDVANGKRHKAGGLHWEWVDNEQSNSEIIIETEN